MNRCFCNYTELSLGFFVACFFIGTVSGAEEMKSGKPVARVTVDAGKIERIDTPVMVELPAGISGSDVRLVEVKDGDRIPVPSQVFKDGNGENLCWILSDKTSADTKRVYELEKGKSTGKQKVEVKDNESAFEVLCADRPVLRYKYGIEPSPERMSKNYERSGFIHPVWSPAGQVLTQIHLPDHIHHMGLWNAWTSAEFENRKIDFWNIKEGKATVRFAKCLETKSGPVFGGFKVLQEHIDLSNPGGAKVALNEDLEVRVWNPGGTEKGYWLFDWISVQRCASSSPLVLHQYRYGGIGFRATAEWGRDNSDYLTSEGKTRKDGHGTRARWCSITGKTAKGEAGLLMMTHPQNREYPEPIRIWSEKDNKEGKVFFNFCPIQQKAWVMEPGRDYMFRYRVCTYDGVMSREMAERLWSDLSSPPEMNLKILAD
ncbi:MAG: PmoA family protein [Kiritimatiellae bacterium]|nr:PmoA family protein [Kiritimatiellia bacterium]MDD5522115.1 PmoA family protein [Kiritimatiellia bacterium]